MRFKTVRHFNRDAVAWLNAAVIKRTEYIDPSPPNPGLKVADGGLDANLLSQDHEAMSQRRPVPVLRFNVAKLAVDPVSIAQTLLVRRAGRLDERDQGESNHPLTPSCTTAPLLVTTDALRISSSRSTASAPSFTNRPTKATRLRA